MSRIVFFIGAIMVFASNCYAYTPLITATTFDGVTADVNSVALAMIGLVMIVCAVGLIIRAVVGK